MPTKLRDTPLNKSTLFYYGLADLPIMLTIIPMAIWLSRFYTGDVGLSLTAVANILLFARLFDVITDPIVGYLSDRTHTPWGRRKPWILASVPFLMLGIYRVFLPPAGADVWYLFWWMMVLWLGWTMLMIPYYAWAAELSDDYNERTRITGWRALMGSVGGIAAQLIPFIALVVFSFGGTANVMQLLGTCLLVLVPLCIGLTLWRVPEVPSERGSQVALWAGLRLMWNNAPFKRLVFGFVLSSTGLAIVMPLYIFYVEFIVVESPANVPYLVIISSIAGFLAIPCWVWLSKRISKHRAWISGLLMLATFSPVYLLLGPGDFWVMMPFIFLMGFATGSFQALPNSMKADVIDLDTVQSGENRAAFFFSAWSLVMKMASSLGGWIALQSLALFGFDAANGAQNTPEALMGLQLTIGVLPASLFVLAAIVMWGYPITKERQQHIRAQIDQRMASQAP
ncbi:MAG: MFS transporter [Pseudomonadales bacterium]